MIQVADIRKRFDSLEVLRGVSLTVGNSEVVAIVGPSGAGKTTLLQIMGSLERPDGGSVTYVDSSGPTNIFDLSPRRLAEFRNRRIGFVFQLHNLLPEFTLEENVALPALIGGDRRADALGRARQLLDYMGLAGRLTHRPAQLSGGERQRAAVARALINNPAVILADEPSGALDSANRNELHRLFFDLRRDRGQSFVIVTHDLDLAAAADRQIRLRDGLLDQS
ncbi:MAG: ABC transporter ATP-binding protein [Muribaculaceae bacterium]|nr:ABC transporter ATP-binding protein [Bacteroidales bacterium]MBD5325091.1 ABC transporter ATP-binding protein [Bacteroides sp.]MDE6228918.1 ABC transporter ATP-binding protein [Muribaculaceae bacterium]MBD5326937.1 ABC transporter ATP-binding protein [Bacteroides sp.]MBD5425180.1 ABC transporter ATP-binding protein [Bacteroides sp.]